jgi:hypothetical protein
MVHHLQNAFLGIKRFGEKKPPMAIPIAENVSLFSGLNEKKVCFQK